MVTSRNLQASFVLLLAVMLAETVRAQSDASALPAQEIIRRASAAVVRITGKDTKGRDIEPGRGFFVASNVIATDYSVIKDAIKINTTTADKKKKEARIIGVDATLTVAILNLEETKAEPLALGAGEQIARGCAVYFPDQSGWNERKVINNTLTDDKLLIEIAARMSREFRGSPVLNDHGEVIAITVMSSDSAAFAVPASYLVPLGEISVEGGFSGQRRNKRIGSAREASNEEGNNKYLVFRDYDSESATGVKLIRKPSNLLFSSAIRRVIPVYPPKARKSRIVGLTTVEMLIDESGDVLWVRAVSGHRFFKEAATAAARGWKFPPSVVKGKPVRVIGLLTFNFTS